ncbi:MAG: hypothetical protein JO305_02560 [Alphaproteobacteria bacterium]|nr:hypothetical protein [Alphaproteobacteria bacterium]
MKSPVYLVSMFAATCLSLGLGISGARAEAEVVVPLPPPLPSFPVKLAPQPQAKPVPPKNVQGRDRDHARSKPVSASKRGPVKNQPEHADRRVSGATIASQQHRARRQPAVARYAERRPDRRGEHPAPTAAPAGALYQAAPPSYPMGPSYGEVVPGPQIASAMPAPMPPPFGYHNGGPPGYGPMGPPPYGYGWPRGPGLPR